MTGLIAFLNPWLLLGLASLPLIYWLLRTVPPRPQQVNFPRRAYSSASRLERRPRAHAMVALLLRLAAAAIVILALAEPVLNPRADKALKGSGPVVIAIDNGWASGPRWNEHVEMASRFLSEAESQNRPVVIAATASPAKTVSVRIEPPAEARSTLAALAPQPFAPDRLTAVAALEATLASSKVSEASVVWLADGIDHGGTARSFAERLEKIAGSGTFAVVGETTAGSEPLAVTGSIGAGGKLEATLLRADAKSARDGVVSAISARGQRLGDARFALKPGETTANAAFDLPLELRNQVTRIEIAGERSAGAVSLLDARSQWHRIGLLSGESQEEAQPLLAPLYYIQRALAPFAELVHPKEVNLAEGIEDILRQNASILVLADIGTLSGELKDRVASWIDKGGVLVRFAGPRLEKGGDDLLPVPLRIGGRTLGGALSWSTPQALAPFEPSSLFAGLSVTADVTVSRQVLADPGRLGPEVQVWARLKDGTPLVTATRKKKGMIVLFHATANSDWSNLPMSGLFVDMLRRISTLGINGGIAGSDASVNTAKDADAANNAEGPNVLPPLQTLDGFGVLKPPPPTAQPVTVADLAAMPATLDHPPGYYGPAASPRAINIAGPKTVLAPLPALPARAERRGYESDAARPLKPGLLGLALALILADIVAVLLLQAGGLAMLLRQLGRRPAPRGGAAAVVLAAFVASALSPLVAGPADAQRAQTTPSATPRAVKPAPSSATDALAMRATSKVTLGYVLTGDPATDDTSRTGLMGLGRVLLQRTAVGPGEPQGVDVNTDELGFYPILYWPVLPNAKPLPTPVLAKIDAYMKQGGLIMFDTRDASTGVPTGLTLSQQQDGPALQRLLGSLDLPRLEPVPEGHVLTKSFYLLRSFPGRWDGGQMWIEADSANAGSGGPGASRKAQHADGVTSIIVTANDMASAWAADDRGRPLYPVVPGGEQQREMAYRVGVNVVMHALTGNYKADQVHVPALSSKGSANDSDGRLQHTPPSVSRDLKEADKELSVDAIHGEVRHVAGDILDAGH